VLPRDESNDRVLRRELGLKRLDTSALVAEIRHRDMIDQMPAQDRLRFAFPAIERCRVELMSRSTSATVVFG
jgi:hypothetical protein